MGADSQADSPFYHTYFTSTYPSTYTGYPYTYSNDVNMYMKNAMPLRQTLQALKRPVTYTTNYQSYNPYPNAVYNWGQSGVQAPVAQRRFVREAESDAEAQFSYFYRQTYPNAYSGFRNTWANHDIAYTPYTNTYAGHPYTTYNTHS